MIRLYLDAPPSLNHLFPSKASGGRRRSAKYNIWATAQTFIAMPQRPRPVTGTVTVSVTVSDKLVRGDLDNRLKALLDLLVDWELIQGDSKKFVRRITIEWGAPMWLGREMGCLVEVEPWGNGQEQESRDCRRPG